MIPNVSTSGGTISNKNITLRKKMASGLEDLDELVLRCRDQRAREFITEAVVSYRAAAFRASIVATWIAVCFDIIEKIRELSLAGDKQALELMDTLDGIRRTEQLKRALEFERNLLEVAKDKFELISPLEYKDLLRLQEDRNRCAHPSLTIDEKPYSPPAELARLHIHSAITHLLQHPPAQGKYALERLIVDVSSDYFPTDARRAKVALLGGPLKKPRESLATNFITVMLKGLLLEELEWKLSMRYSAALLAAGKMHPASFANTLKAKFSVIAAAVKDDNLHRLTAFLRELPDTWQYLENAVQQRLQDFVRRLPSSHLEQIIFLIRIVPLRQPALARMKTITEKELDVALFFEIPDELGDWMIEKYLASSSFASANEWGKHLAFYVDELSIDHLHAILRGVSANNQLMGSFQLGPLLQKIKKTEKISTAELDQMIVEQGLEEFFPTEDNAADPE